MHAEDVGLGVHFMGLQVVPAKPTLLSLTMMVPLVWPHRDTNSCFLKDGCSSKTSKSNNRSGVRKSKGPAVGNHGSCVGVWAAPPGLLSWMPGGCVHWGVAGAGGVLTIEEVSRGGIDVVPWGESVVLQSLERMLVQMAYTYYYWLA